MHILIFTLITAAAWAQDTQIAVPEITVMGTKGGVLESVPTANELAGPRLERKKQSSVGETLSREAGISSTQFGPNASRPVIRGQDGDRIRILQNGTGQLDASAASPDHAVAMEPLVVERMEVVRGPGALLYGPSAVSGAVNLVTSRILDQQPDAINGKADTRYSSHDAGRAGALSLNTPLGQRWALHADMSQRASDDYRVPGYARTALRRESSPLDPEDKGRVYNSFSRSGAQALGVSYFFNDGYVGTSFANTESKYGTVAERDVHIHLLQQRWDLTGEVRSTGFVEAMKFKNSYSHYKHDEMEGSVLGTAFKNDGNETRADFHHKAVAGFAGIFGVQGNVFQFSAKGEESYLPPTDNQTYSIFVYEERQEGRFKPSFGARFDAASVAAKDDPAFGPGERKSFDGGSLALGFLYQVTQSGALVLNTAYTERAPNAQELFANGPHAATESFEIGDKNLKKERSQSAELFWRHKAGLVTGSVGVFLQDIKDYIALSPTGAADASSGFPEYAYQGVDARLYGGELNMRHVLPLPLPGMLEAELKADFVRGINRRTGDNLPRMTPVRETIGFVYKTGTYQADLEVERTEGQKLTAPGETATGEYTLVNLGAEIPFRTGALDLTASLRVNNVFGTEARNHVSLLKEIAPLPGRSFIVGLQAAF